MVWEWLTEESIEGAVRERDVEWLVRLIREGDNLTPEFRQYLASVIADLLTRKRKFPRRRPKKKRLESENTESKSRYGKL
jgi:hypothetical protein